jgi:2-oxo-3-hexenedioate decarboxylase/2-keto-4-pentenoate hydratase
VIEGAIDRAAEVLRESRLERSRFGAFSADLEPADEAEAYTIQDRLHARLAASGWGRVVGYKIGCTTPVMQAYLGIHNPCAGAVFDTTVFYESGRFAIPPVLRVGVECEIAVTLGQDITPSAAPIDEAAAGRAVASCAAAIEIVEDRYLDYPSLRAPALIADDFFGAGCVLGKANPDFRPQRLADVTAAMWINGISVGSGSGSDVLGNPLRALTWLANNLAGRGITLRAGEFILLGSLVQTNWVKAGDEVVIRNDPLGEARAAFD